MIANRQRLTYFAIILSIVGQYGLSERADVVLRSMGLTSLVSLKDPAIREDLGEKVVAIYLRQEQLVEQSSCESHRCESITLWVVPRSTLRIVGLSSRSDGRRRFVVLADVESATSRLVDSYETSECAI